MLFGWFSPKNDSGSDIQTTKSKRSRRMQTAAQFNPSPVTPDGDGSIVIDSSQLSAYWGTTFDLDGAVTDEIQMISRYREISHYPDCDNAIEQIVNDAIVVDDEYTAVSLNLEKLPEQFDAIKSKITDEFEKVLQLYDFNENCHDIFKRWYIDGRLYYFMDVDAENPVNGIREIRYIDPRKIKKITEVTKENVKGVDVVKGIETYYLFNDAGLNGAAKGVKLNPNAIVFVPSGQIEPMSGKYVSYLHKAIKPVNQLKMMEDSLVIYRITRAPERRIFYVDIANLPQSKAEQYVKGIMDKYRNKVQYNAVTGETNNAKNFLCTQEDFFIPRREGGRSTEIQTLPGGSNLSEIADIEYFQKKLYQAMEVPRQRLMSESTFQVGRTAEITREEVIFSKFIKRLRNKFNTLFREPLRIQLIAKNIIKEDEWDEIKNYILFDYHQDNYFEELKENEVMTERLNQLQILEAYRGEFFSKEYIALNILKFSEEQWKLMKEQMAVESDNGGESSEESGESLDTGSLGGDESSGSDGLDNFNPMSPENNAAGDEIQADTDSGETEPSTPDGGGGLQSPDEASINV